MKKKILMVSIPSLHFFRWTHQIKDSGYEIYWFDISGAGGYHSKIDFVTQYTNWNNKIHFPAKYYLKKRFPKIFQWVQKYNERDVNREFEKVLQIVQPDLVHSFALYLSCTPILKTMEKHPGLKWIYSSWGSDLYYFKNVPNYLVDIKRVLPRVDYLFTDCQRDYKIAQDLGFKGEFLGVFPGGGGFDLQAMQKFIKPLDERKIILIKGFQGRSGRCISVLQSVLKLKEKLKLFNIVVFGADNEVFKFVSVSELINWENFTVLGKINHREVLHMMGKALIYIGNSNSDGMPNTLLEAICLGAFPIQSNPGDVTKEIIEVGKNGLLISNYNDVEEIKNHIIFSISNPGIIRKAFSFNQKEIKPNLDFDKLKREVLICYEKIENDY